MSIESLVSKEYYANGQDKRSNNIKIDAVKALKATFNIDFIQENWSNFKKLFFTQKNGQASFLHMKDTYETIAFYLNKYSKSKIN